MSPSWHKRLYVGLAPRELSLLGFGRGLQPCLEIAARIPVAAEAGQDGWQPALDALAQWLAAHPAGWRTHCVLSNHFVRYAVLPADSRLRSEAEGLALAGALFEERYGTASRDWSIRISPPFDQGGTLVSAVPRSLLDGLTRIGTAKPLAVRPLLMEIANRTGPLVTSGRFTLAMVEQERITLAHARDGLWASVSSRAVAEDDRSALSRLLHEESELAGTTVGECWLDELAGGQEGQSRCRQIHLRDIDGAPACLALRGVA